MKDDTTCGKVVEFILNGFGINGRHKNLLWNLYNLGFVFNRFSFYC